VIVMLREVADDLERDLSIAEQAGTAKRSPAYAPASTEEARRVRELTHHIAELIGVEIEAGVQTSGLA
jgi:hypothetical protein